MPAPASTRVLWKGAISLGLVHIPIALHSAVQSQSIDFDWLDRRSMDPVGYKRINKVTGEEIDRADIVKGIKQDDGEYVIMEAEEIAAAYPKTTQTVEIEAFVPIDAIPFVYLERPYYVAPINKAGKVYALLREVLSESHLAGLAKVVIQTKQHLAVLFACGPVLILNLLRWDDEVRDWAALNLPEQDKKAVGLSEKDLDMARQLVGDMTIDWEPERFTDSFREQIMQLVQEKIDAGDTQQVTKPESEETEPGTARIYDLTELLQRSLRGRKDSGTTEDAPRKTSTSSTARTDKASASKATASKATAKKTTAKKATAKKTAAKKAATKKTSKTQSATAAKKTSARKTAAPKKTSTATKSAKTASSRQSNSGKRRAA